MLERTILTIKGQRGGGWGVLDLHEYQNLTRLQKA